MVIVEALVVAQDQEFATNIGTQNHKVDIGENN